MYKYPQYNQYTEQKQHKPEVEKIYSKRKSWPPQHIYLKRNTGYHTRGNPSEGTISERSQIKKLHETIKIINEEVTLSKSIYI